MARKTSEALDRNWDFYEIVDKLTNKNGFRYSYAIADPLFQHVKYRQTDLYPYHARFSFEDSPATIAFTKDALGVTTNEPWHTARANVCVREGTYYFETRVISGIVNGSQAIPRNGASGSSPRGHVRLGYARREADLDANVGVDCYGYGIRDVNGEGVNRMRCEHFFPKGESVCEGDVIGMLITLPPLSLHKSIVEGTYDPTANGDGSANRTDNNTPVATNIIRDRIPFHYRSDFCWQQSNVFPTKQLRDYAYNLKETPTFARPSPVNSEDASLRTLPGSSITVYKNGVNMGTPFKDLYAFLPPASRFTNGTNNLGIGERENADDGMIGYYPAVSCFGGGAAECRFEPPWWIGPPPTIETGEAVRPVGERFNEQIAEDVLADIVDEVEAMSMWGGTDGNVVGAAAARPEQSGSPAVGGVSSENTKGGTDAAAYDSPTPADLPAAGSVNANRSSNGENAVSKDAAGLGDAGLNGAAAADTPNAEASSAAPVDADGDEEMTTS